MKFEDVVDLLSDPDWTLVDVLPERVYRKGHLPTARSLPLEEIGQRAAQVLPAKNAAVLLYCRNQH